MIKEQEKILVDYQEQWIHQLPKLRNIANEFDIFPQIVRCSEIKGSQVLSRMVVQPKCVAILIFMDYPFFPVLLGGGTLYILINGKVEFSLDSWVSFTEPVLLKLETGDLIEICYENTTEDSLLINDIAIGLCYERMESGRRNGIELFNIMDFGTYGKFADVLKCMKVNGKVALLPFEYIQNGITMFGGHGGWEVVLYRFTVSDGYQYILPFEFSSSVNFNTETINFLVKINGRVMDMLPTPSLLNSKRIYPVQSGDKIEITAMLFEGAAIEFEKNPKLYLMTECTESEFEAYKNFMDDYDIYCSADDLISGYAKELENIKNLSENERDDLFNKIYYLRELKKNPPDISAARKNRDSTEIINETKGMEIHRI